MNRPMPLQAGTIYIGRGDADLIVAPRSTGMIAMSVPSQRDYPWHPSVERMVTSALEHYDATQLIGVLMTGMGRDGADAMTRLREQGGRTIAEAEVERHCLGHARRTRKKWRSRAGAAGRRDRRGDRSNWWVHMPFVKRDVTAPASTGRRPGDDACAALRTVWRRILRHWAVPISRSDGKRRGRLAVVPTRSRRLRRRWAWSRSPASERRS